MITYKYIYTHINTTARKMRNCKYMVRSRKNPTETLKRNPLFDHIARIQNVGRYVQILTNIDQILTKKRNKLQKHFFFPKGMSTKKTPAALVSVAKMGWGYQY